MNYAYQQRRKRIPKAQVHHAYLCRAVAAARPPAPTQKVHGRGNVTVSPLGTFTSAVEGPRPLACRPPITYTTPRRLGASTIEIWGFGVCQPCGGDTGQNQQTSSTKPTSTPRKLSMPRPFLRRNIPRPVAAFKGLCRELCFNRYCHLPMVAMPRRERRMDRGSV